MSAGNAFKQIFETTMLNLNGAELIIYRNWGKAEMTSIESKAIKETNKFKFPIDTEIEKNDVIQITGTKSFWKVIDIDEDIKMGVPTNLAVRVIKIDQLGNEILINSHGKAIFNAPVYGGVQVGGQNNSQTNTVNINSDFTKAISDLLALVENSSLNPVQKINAKSDVQLIRDLADLDKTDEVKQLATSKIEAIKDVIATTADMTSLGMVIIPILHAMFQ